MFGLVTLRRHRAEIAALNADRDRLRDERDQFAKDRDAVKAAARPTPDGSVLEEHDSNRKALADALGDQKRHLNWHQLIADVVRLNKAAHAWMTDYETEKQRADRLEAGLPTASAEEIAAWEARVKAHHGWTPTNELEKRPIDGASGRPAHPATDLRRALDRCSALERRLAQAEGRRRGVIGS